MESKTKYRQSRETICRMTKRWFPDEEIDGHTELTEGYFNVAYDIRLKSGKSVILKIAPSKGTTLMSYEKDIMFSEVDAMRRAALEGNIPVPEIYGFDASCEICASPYFFMEKLEGCSLSSCKCDLEPKIRDSLTRQTADVLRKINEIDCPRFGYPAQPECQGGEWYPTFRRMFEMGISDAKAKNIDLQISTDQLLEKLERDRALFDEITEPKLVHWDSWDGNFFVKDGELIGVIDWERCIWGDPLMEYGFRNFMISKPFLEGYGKEYMTASEQRRCLWYDVFLLLLLSLEKEYRDYVTDDLFKWSIGMLRKQFALLG